MLNYLKNLTSKWELTLREEQMLLQLEKFTTWYEASNTRVDKWLANKAKSSIKFIRSQIRLRRFWALLGR